MVHNRITLLSVYSVIIVLTLSACTQIVTPTHNITTNSPQQTESPTSTRAPSITPSETSKPTPSPSPTFTPTAEPTPQPTDTPEPCSPAKEGPLAGLDPRSQTIIWWHNYSTERDLYAIVFDFNYSNLCEIKVELKYQGNYDSIRDKMISALARGNLPDLVVGYQNDQAFYQKKKGLVDLNTYIQDKHWGLSPEEQADFYPSFWNQSVHPAYDNQRLGFAINRSMEVIFSNTTWARELGFDRAPKTPLEFENQACAAANFNGDGTGGYILRNNASAVAAWTFAFGGDIIDASGTKYDFSSQATIEALTMLKRMYDNRCAFYWKGYPNTAFASRRALFTQGSTSGLPFYLSDLKKAGKGDQLEMIAIPHTSLEPRQDVYGGDIMIPTTTPERQLAAWIFIKWFTSPEVQSLWVKVSSYYPTRMSASELLQSYMLNNPTWTNAFNLLPYGVFEPQLVSYDTVRDLVQKTFDKIMHSDGTRIKEMLEQLTEKANQLQNEQSQ